MRHLICAFKSITDIEAHNEGFYTLDTTPLSFQRSAVLSSFSTCEQWGLLICPTVNFVGGSGGSREVTRL